MRNFTAIALLILLSLASIGAFPVFKLLQFHAQQQTKKALRQIAPDNLVVFTNIHSNSDVVWQDNDEFQLHGQLYDVVSTEQEKGVHYYYCFDDRNESRIFNSINAFLNRQVGNNNTPYGNAVIYLLRIITSVFIAGSISLCMQGALSASVAARFRYRNQHLSFVVDIPSPPPRTVA